MNIVTKKEGATHDEAIKYIKTNQKVLIEKFTSEIESVSENEPISLFMAGSPGAGKTEYSKSFIENTRFNAVRIDPDEIKEFLPMYNGSNSNEVQAAANIGVEKLYDYALENKLNLLLDSTFTPFDKIHLNIKRSVKKNRHVEIHYLYQDPLIAWDFTRKRAVVEGRDVPKVMFVQALFESRENVKRIKEEFGSDVTVTFVINDFTNDKIEYFQSINEIDRRTNIPYNKDELLQKLLS